MTPPSELQVPYPRIVEAATDSAGKLVMEDLIQFIEDEWVATYLRHESSWSNDHEVSGPGLQLFFTIKRPRAAVM